MSEVLDFLNMSDEEAVKGLRDIREKAREGHFENLDFPISKIKPGSSATFRPLPDKNKNTYPNFWLVRKTIPLAFVDPDNDENFVKINIPVREMYDSTRNSCPVVNLVRPYYAAAKEAKEAGKTTDAEHLEKIANKHWIKPDFIFQGFVVKPGFDEENPPTNPIRIVSMKKTLFKILWARIDPRDADPLPVLPIHPKLGYNFIIRKTQKGEYPSYETSSWAQQSTPLTDEQTAALEKHGLNDLTIRLPKRPSEDEYKVLAQIMQTSLEHEGNATWDSDWDSLLLTVKPFKVDKSGKSLKKKNETGSNLSARVRERLAAGDEGGMSSSEVVSGLKRAPKAEPGVVVVETGPESVQDVKPEKTETAKGGSDLAARIRSKMNK